MKKIIALLMITTLWLAGCSTRSDEGDDGLAIGAALDTVEQLPPPASILIGSDKPTIITGGSDTALITATVVDGNNRGVEGYMVEFSADGGALRVTEDTAKTDDAGQATAELTISGDYRNKVITVTAAVDGVSASVPVNSGGTTLIMKASDDLVVGDTADLQFELLAGDETPIPNQTIAFSSEVGNTFSQNSVITNALGIGRVSLSTNAGSDTVYASALGGSVSVATPLSVAEPVEEEIIPIRIRVISNESVIETGGNDIARITTLVTDESNRVLGGKQVSFSSTGGVLQNITSVTNEAGQATAELSLAGDYRNQEIVVSASVETENGSVTVAAEGSKLSIAGPTALVSGDFAELELTLTGGNGQPIANEQLNLETAAGNTVQPPVVTTDADGKAIVNVGSVAGSDEVTVTALDESVVASHAIQVAADVLTVVYETTPYDSLPVGLFSPFSVQWTSNGIPVANQMMRFAVTAGLVQDIGGVPSSNVDVVTDAFGIARVEVSSNSAGPVTVSYSDSLDSDPLSQYDVEYVATTPSTITLESTPASVATGNSSTVSALVTDVYGNPVVNTVVEFGSDDLRGGSLSPVSAITDREGRAAITFNAGSLPTEINGIELLATAVDYPTVSQATTRLTVTERQLNVIIGLSDMLSEVETDTRYNRTGVVQVTDGAGRPVPDATIQVTLTPAYYHFGYMEPEDTDSDGNLDTWLPQYTMTCASEDYNGNRVLDPGEDFNANGVLDPRDPALVDADPGNLPTVIGSQITTGSSGVGFFMIAYPQSNALWFDVQVTARVEALGTEAVAYHTSSLGIITTDIDDVQEEPPNIISPYGIGPGPAAPNCL